MPAILLTIALIVAAIWSEIGLPGHGHALPWWLRPSATGTAMLCVGLWVAALFVYWFPRRNQRRSWELLGIGGAAGLAVILGVAAVAPCNGPSDDWLLTPIWRTMVLFVGTSPASFDLGGNCFTGSGDSELSTVPLAAQAARFAAMAAIFGAAIAVVLKVGEQQLSRLRAFRDVLPQVVIGIDDVGLPLVKSLVDWRAQGEDVAVLALEGQDDAAAEARELGARSFVIRSRSNRRVAHESADRRPGQGAAQALVRARDRDQLVDSIRPFLTTRGRRFLPFGRRRFVVETVWIMDADLDRALLIREAVQQIAGEHPPPLPKPEEGVVAAQVPNPASVSSTAPSPTEVRVVVRCDDRLVAQRLRALWIQRPTDGEATPATGEATPDDVDGEQPARLLCDAISYNQVTAAELVGRVARDMASLGTDYSLVVCGDTALAEAIAAEVMLRAWEEADLAAAWRAHQGHSTDDPCQQTSGAQSGHPMGDPQDILVGGRMPSRLVLVDSQARVMAENLLAGGLPGDGVGLPALGYVATPWDGLAGDEQPTLVTGEVDRREIGDTPVAVIIADEVPADRHHLAARINTLLDPRRCIVWQQPQAGDLDGVEETESADGQSLRLRIETYRNDILLYGLWPEDSWIRAARHAHERYRRVYFDEGGAESPTRHPWWHSNPVIPPKDRKAIRDDNIRQVHQALTLTLAGGGAWVVRAPGEDAWKPSETQVDRLGQAEHERWCADRIAGDWTWGPVRNNTTKKHPQLVAWSELDEADQERSLVAGQHILMHISASGFALSTSTASDGGSAPAGGDVPTDR